MSDNDRPDPLVRVSDRPEEVPFAHPLNPDSEMRGVMLGDLTGLQRTGVNLITVPPGKESCVRHTHTAEEEFVFILSGRGVAEIDDEEFEVGPGDFMGFPTPSVAHHLRNASDEDLVYLVGGERKEVEIADFPVLGKTVLRVGREAKLVDHTDVETFWKPDE
jgi:uncharacterized cupin superfamily protein